MAIVTRLVPHSASTAKWMEGMNQSPTTGTQLVQGTVSPVDKTHQQSLVMFFGPYILVTIHVSQRIMWAILEVRQLKLLLQVSYTDKHYLHLS